MENVKHYEFDMCYALAEYKSPQFQLTSFDLVKERLVPMTYSNEIMQYEYDDSYTWFMVRCSL